MPRIDAAIAPADDLPSGCVRIRHWLAAALLRQRLPRSRSCPNRPTFASAIRAVATEQIEYRTPIKFGGRVVTDVVLLNVDVEVETRDGRRGRGFGSMPMGNVWAWPSKQVSAEQTLAAMIALGERLVRDADALPAGRPSAGDHARLGRSARAIGRRGRQAPLGLAEPMPRLAQLVAASPLEAAIHDAYGKALGQNSYNLLGAGVRQRRSGALPVGASSPASISTATRCASRSRDAAVSPGRRARPADRRRRRHAGRRRPARDAARVDRRRRADAPEDQAQRRRPGLGRRPRGGGRARRGRGPSSARLHGVALLARLQREVRERRVRARLPGASSRAARRRPSRGCSTSSSRRIATCGPIPRTACTRRPRSSRW